jgi:hypothetical protein
MKRVFSIIAFLMLATWWVGCEKNKYGVTERTEVTDKALVKIGYFVASITNQPVQAKINGSRVSPTLAYNTPFPGGGLNTGGSNNSDFLVLDPGNVNVQLSIPKVGTETDSVKVFDAQFTFTAKRQTLFLTDSFPNITGVLVDNETPATTDSGKVRINFVHLIPNVGPVDLYKGAEKLKENIGYKESTEFFDTFAGNATYAIKEAGTSTTIASRAIAPAAGRIYTFFSRGFKGAAGGLVPNVSAIIIQ